MKILAVDDEQLQLEKLSEAILEVVPDAMLVKTKRPSEALYLAEDMDFDVAFLDIQMRNMTGIELGTMLKRIAPHLNIVFVTAYNEFKADAMDLRASGYVSKPVNAEKIRQELLNLRYPVSETKKHASSENIFIRSAEAEKKEEKKKLLYVQCFGNFDVYDKDHKALRFKRTKAKEMMAYLIFKRGARCTSREIATVLYEDSEYSTKIQDSFRHVSSALLQALKAVGAEEVLMKEHQNYGLNLSLIDCDYFDFINKTTSSQVTYTGEFMAQYSWAEYINGYLDSQI